MPLLPKSVTISFFIVLLTFFTRDYLQKICNLIQFNESDQQGWPVEVQVGVDTLGGHQERTALSPI